jgi:VWFA-related protein
VAAAATLLCLAGVALAQTQERPEEVVRVESELAQTDVAVFDKSGRFVEGLGREQFELKVDGRAVPVAFFERVSGGVAKGGGTVDEGAAGKRAAAGASGAAAPRARGRVVIFFIDDLHLSLDSLGRTRSALSHFLDEEMAPGDLAAFVTASGQLGFLQQFTDNKVVLRAAVARLKPVPDTVRDTDQPPMSEYVAVRILNGDRDAADFYIEKILQGFATRSNTRGMNRNGIFEMVRGRATNIAKGMESVAAASLGSLEQLVRVAGQIEGRKLIFFVSDGFYLDGKNSASGANHRLQRVTDAAARNGSVVYSIDARGLFAPFNDATGEKAHDPKGRLERASVGESLLSQDGLSALAGDTGGQFLKNTNYFDRWVSRVLEETSNYYRIAWRPEGEGQRQGRFRRVEVSVAGRPDLTVRLHRGYLTAAARGVEEPKAAAAKSAGEGAPDAGGRGAEADFRAALSAPVGRRDLPTVLSASFVDVPGSGAVLTSSVEVSTAGLDYGADGRQPAAVDVVGLVLSEQGRQVSTFKTRLNVAAEAAPSSSSAGRPGVIYNYRAPVAPGLYQVKAAARDSRGGRVGSAAQWIEIPDLSKKRLTLSSIHLGGREVGGGGRGVDAKGAPQVQFSVDRRFPRSSRLSFLAFVYNAAPGGEGLSVTVRVLRDNRAVVAAPARKLAPEAGSDASRLPVTGAVSLGQLPPGRYEIEIAVADNVAGATAAERVGFDLE